jgi:uncharacterized protein
MAIAKRMASAGVWLLAVVLSGASYAASFHCDTHSKPDEVAICGDSNLSSLDDEMASAYKNVLATMAPERVTGFRQAQLDWLKTRRACGGNRSCLDRAYRQRLTILQEMSSSVDDIKGPVSETEITQALAILSYAFACPIKPIFRKEVRDGVMLFYNSQVFKQEFKGDRAKLRFSLVEEFAQKTEQGLGGSYDAIYRREGEVDFKQLENGRLQKDDTAHSSPDMNVLISCSGRKPCFTHTRDGKKASETEATLLFCDPDTAKNALTALKILIKANKP